MLGGLTGVFAVALRAFAQPALGPELPFVVAFPATVVAALLWGTGPGLLTAALCAAAAAMPIGPFAGAVAMRPAQAGAFLVAGIVVALVCGRYAGLPRPTAEALPDGVPESALTAWLRAVLWGAFLIPSTVFVAAAGWGYERAQRDAELAAARVRDVVYLHALRSFDVAAEIASRADRAAPAGGPQLDPAGLHQRLSDMAAGLHSVVNLNVWDADGRSIARSDRFPADRSTSIADRAYFVEQRERPTPLGISEVLIGRQSGVELMNAALRRSAPDGSFHGIVAVSLSPEYFRSYYRSLAREDPKISTLVLIREDGAVLARWPQEARTAPADLAWLQGRAESGSQVLPADDQREARLISFRRVGAYPLYVMAGFSRDALFSGWARFVGLLAAVLVPVTAGLVYVSWVALKKTRHEQATAHALQEQMRRTASAERSMVEAQKLETLAVVTGGVAHDINNLLATLSASLHVHQRRHPELAGEKQVEAMARAVQSGVRLTRQLLSYSRKQALRSETVRLQDWLPGTEGLIRSALGPRIAWQCSVAPDTRPVHVDPGELELALINLVVNARHAMPEGGSLAVRAENLPHTGQPGAERVVVSVTDSGTGIAPELLDKVFEPFFTTRERGVGSGLGLSQVRGFCQQAGGDVSIDSRVGRGTSVRMVLPASSEPVVEPVALKAAAPPVIDGHVLLVEDNDDVAATTALLLRTAGLTVTRVGNADAAQERLHGAHGFDVVLSDVAMPGRVNGIALALELRASQPSLPVLLTTGYADQVSEAVAAGLKVLPKPVPPEDLLAELRSVLERR
jgi:two-component system NtrC family sensor kinase